MFGDLEHTVENSNYLRKYLPNGGNGSKYNLDESNADVKALVEETKRTNNCGQCDFASQWSLIAQGGVI